MSDLRRAGLNQGHLHRGHVHRGRSRRALVAAMVMLTAVACTGTDGGARPSVSAPRTADQHAQVLEVRTANGLGATRLAPGAVPPTNRWYSSLAFGQGGLPVYPRPLSMTPRDGGFSMGLTTPVASANAIIGAARDDVAVSIDGARGFGVVSRADSVAVALTMGPAKVTMAQGWPAVGIVADAALTAQIFVSFASVGEGLGVATVNGVEYGIVVDGGTVDGTRLSLDQGGSAAIFAVPDGIDAAAFASALGASSPRVTVSSSLSDDAATTTVTYGDSPTVVVVPQSRATDGGLTCDLGTFATIDGPYAACAASEVSWDVPRITPSDALSLDGITADEKSAIVAALQVDAKGGPADLPGDSYFGPKAMYRLANLIQVADALGETALADQVATKLATELQSWADPQGCSTRDAKCLVYDPEIKGVVGLTPSFGSEDFNDHHFHYGYLLYAAAVAGARDAALLADIGPSLDLVADDIASPVATDDFPQWRAFDPVAGHSWASGSAPFADGNNQESSSEAVAAWNGVALWRSLRGDAEAAGVAEWMLSAEAEAARRIYLEPDVSAFPEYLHGTVGIEWGSKRDFATWFSAEPNAIVGIQLIPSPPAAMDYYAVVAPASVASAIDAARGEGSGVQFSDYLLMYQAAQSGVEANAAWDAALVLPDGSIDDANSRAYMLAWIASQRQ